MWRILDLKSHQYSCLARWRPQVCECTCVYRYELWVMRSLRIWFEEESIHNPSPVWNTDALLQPLGPVLTFALAAMLFTLRETKQTAAAAVGETNLPVFPPINNVCASAENQVFAEIDGKFQPCVFHPHGSQIIRLTAAWCNSTTQTVLFLQMESQNSLGFIWKTHQETALSA